MIKEESMVDKLKHYFNTTSDEQIQKDWDNTVKQTEGIESPTLEEFSKRLDEITLEQAALNYAKTLSGYPKWNEQDANTFIAGANYQAERMYSEEELRKLCLDFFYYWYNAPGNNTEQGFDKWFEQNKKK